ncbi:MAG: hypothetical protein LBE85_12510 [Candidatus Accumulibacter sp.]|jgi:hypothetical protein|nr:hypothetical protein [Accumulibacter sp.]
MTIGAELLLMLAIAGLYLYDSALLLYCNEAVLIPAGKDGWTVGFGSERFGAAGRELYVPNPFLLHRPLFRLSWKFENDGEVCAPSPLPRGAFSRLAPLPWIMAAALFVLFPLGFFTRLGDSILLPALILLFSSILTALAWLWRHRTEFDLSGGRFAGLAFESIVCPPFALNLIRHVALAMPIHEDLVSAARRLQEASAWEQTRERLILRLVNEIELTEPGSARYELLEKRRQSLLGECAPCPS